MADLTDYTAVKLLSLLQAGEVTSTELTKSYLDRIETYDQKIGSFLRADPKESLEHAAAMDRRRKAGEALGPLAGLPVALKDNLCTRGQTTTCGSRMLKNFKPPYDATVVEKLREAGAVPLGKTNLDEFAMGSSTESSALGETCNPWNTNCIPGGSSGGAATCIASGMSPLSIGSDTGGSIRQPAAFCGVVGLKPTYGRVSRLGLVAFASSLDQIGPLARTAEDAALLLEVIAGHDARDSTSLDQTVPRYRSVLQQPLTGLKLGVVEEHFGEGLDAEVESAVRESIRVYQELGAKITPVSLPHSEYAIATYYVIAPCEASSNLARYDGVHYGYRTDENILHATLKQQRAKLSAAGNEQALNDLDSPLVRMYRQTRAEGFGAEVKRRIMLGTYALSAGYYEAYYLKALKARRLIRQDYDEAFRDVDLVIGPVTPTPAFPRGSKIDDPLAMYLGDLYTVSANLAGVPAISVPCGFSNAGLPIGLQLQGPPLSEDRLLQAAHWFQKETAWHQRRPALN
jgi:aspartyl-tRNA(Asn)/glutamyl-tRNA(Gln) amidotransferase subunit A